MPREPAFVPAVRSETAAPYAVPGATSFPTETLLARIERAGPAALDDHELLCLRHRRRYRDPGQPHIKLLSHQYLTAIVIIKSSPNALLPDTDLRTLALEQIHRHVPNHT